MALKLESSMTDLMTSLTVVFIMLMLALAQNQSAGSRHILNEIKEQVKDALVSENLECISKKQDPLSCTITLPEEKLRFLSNSSICNEKCQSFLKTIFPKIMNVLTKEDISPNVEAIYIEGFTDDIGNDTYNLQLSQERAFNIGKYLLEGIFNTKKEPMRESLLKWLYLNGRGERDLKCLDDSSGTCSGSLVDRDKSRRVEITIRVKSQEVRKFIEES